MMIASASLHEATDHQEQLLISSRIADRIAGGATISLASLTGDTFDRQHAAEHTVAVPTITITVAEVRAECASTLSCRRA